MGKHPLKTSFHWDMRCPCLTPIWDISSVLGSWGDWLESALFQDGITATPFSLLKKSQGVRDLEAFFVNSACMQFGLRLTLILKCYTVKMHSTPFRAWVITLQTFCSLNSTSENEVHALCAYVGGTSVFHLFKQLFVCFRGVSEASQLDDASEGLC